MLTPGKRRWLMAVGISALICLAIFIYANRDGCWLLWHSYSDLSLFLFPFAWLLLFFGLHNRGRAGLVLITVVLALFWPESFSLRHAVAHVHAIVKLRALQSSIAATKNKSGIFPESISAPQMVYPDEKSYEFHYIPIRNTSGGITDYRVHADLSELGRRCGCEVSYMIESTGKIHYNIYLPSATAADPILE